jgi:hypothetical protein
MKISCIPVSLFKTIQNRGISIREWAYEAKEMGLEGMDLSVIIIKDLTLVYFENLKKDLAQGNIPSVMITAYPDFIQPDMLQRGRVQK